MLNRISIYGETYFQKQIVGKFADQLVSWYIEQPGKFLKNLLLRPFR